VTCRKTSNKTVNKLSRQNKALTYTVHGRGSLGAFVRVFCIREVENDVELPEPKVMKNLTGQYRQVKKVHDYLAKVKGGRRALPTNIPERHNRRWSSLVRKEKAGSDRCRPEFGEVRRQCGIECPVGARRRCPGVRKVRRKVRGRIAVVASAGRTAPPTTVVAKLKGGGWIDTVIARTDRALEGYAR
jgi:hypothetical protein